MLVEQISVFIENKAGRLLKMAEVLKENDINLVTLSIADTKDYGILRGITKDNQKALEVLRSSGFTACLTKLIGIEVDDKPGGMLRILQLFNDNEISIEYLYSFARIEKDKAIILLRVEKVTEALEMLSQNGIKVIGESDIFSK